MVSDENGYFNSENMIPVTLVGKTLGERHRSLNAAVAAAAARGARPDFGGISRASERSAVDRIFKIKLASELRNIDYILQNLKDDDLLYVSEALKCKWLLEPQYEHLITPDYLEECLYPAMTPPAASRMRHWVYVNVKTPRRCRGFYLYYVHTNFKLAVKFLRRCSVEFINEEFPKQMHKVSPHDFKILCERNPSIAKVFFDNLLTNEKLKERYLKHERQYFTAIIFLLKCNGSIVLDIAEKYFDRRTMKPFNAKATKFIMKHHRARFLQKPELYTALLLNMKALADELNTEDATDLLLTLARDNYLSSKKWFSYKKVEPIVKRIKIEDRGAVKRRIFENKDIGPMVPEWPYEIPSSSKLKRKVNVIFEEPKFGYSRFEQLDTFEETHGQLFGLHSFTTSHNQFGKPAKIKTPLDRLFEEFRVASFERTLVELRARMRASGCAQARLHMALVLVSKCGARADSLGALLGLLHERRNEPEHARAAVARSLVRRARAWAAPAAAWARLGDWARGLHCAELQHAALLRALLAPGPARAPPAELAAHRGSFAALLDYPLTARERRALAAALPPPLLAAAAAESEPAALEAAVRRALDALAALRVSPRGFPALLARVAELAAADAARVADILRQLYRDGIARRELFEVNFALYQNEDSYMNALRHDVDLISTEKLIELILDDKKFKYGRFFRKIAIYFREREGLTDRLLTALKENGRDKRMAKPLVLLLGDEVASFLAAVDGSIADAGDRSFAAALRANLHLARPALDVDALGWRTVGVKAVANKVMVCRRAEVDDYVTKLLQNKRTIKLACSVAERSTATKYFDCYTILSKVKPTAALKKGFKIVMRDRKVPANPVDIWNVVEKLIEKFDTNTVSKRYFYLPTIPHMPSHLRPPYTVIMYKITRKESFYDATGYLCHIENLIPQVDEQFIESVLLEYFHGDGFPEPVEDEWKARHKVNDNCMLIRMVIRYLLACKTEEIQTRRNEVIGTLFFDKMGSWLRLDKYKNDRKKYLNEILTGFRNDDIFLNNEYVSCMPVMLAALRWMQTYFPINKCAKDFVRMQLNTLYYAALQSSVRAVPGWRGDERSLMEVRALLGHTFGKHLSREIDSLNKTYFSSMQYLYKDIILYSASSFIPRCETFTKSLITSMLDESESDRGGTFAVYLFKDRIDYLGTVFHQDIAQKIKNCGNIELQMIFFAETFSEM